MRNHRRRPTSPTRHRAAGPLLDPWTVAGLWTPAAATAGAGWSAPRRRSRGATATLRGVPGVCSTLLARPRRRRPHRRRGRRAPGRTLPAVEAAPRRPAPAARARPSSRPSTPRWSGARTPCGRSSATASGPSPRCELLGRGDAAPAGLAVLLSLHQALSALDRLEVRGRDSAGLEVQLTGHGLDLGGPGGRRRSLADRGPPAVHRRQRPVWPTACCVFVYKAAAEIGELGDNTAALRAAIRGDELLQLALAVARRRGPRPGPHPLGVGRHHLRAQRPPAELRRDRPARSTARSSPRCSTATSTTSPTSSRPTTCALPAEITTDAKVIPSLMSPRRWPRAAPRGRLPRHGGRARGLGRHRAPRRRRDPDRLCLALRGSGQALYVGLAEDAFIVASEPYGVVEETSHYLRMDGETPADPDNPTASRGQIIELRRRGRRHRRRASTAGPTTAPSCPSTAAELATAEITTRDIDRGDVPALPAQGDHRRRRRRSARPCGASWSSGRPTGRWCSATTRCPPAVARRPAPDGIDRVLVIGQGTAAVAGQSLALAPRPTAGRHAGPGRGPAGHRAVGLPAAGRHVRHAGRRHQPVRHHHRHQPHRRPGPRPRARR